MPPRRTFDGAPGTACCACCAAELAYYRDKEARKREQTRLAVARHRARKPDGKPDGKPDAEPVSLTPGQVTPRKPNPPGPPVSSSLSKEREDVGRVLAPFAERGYAHDPEWWQRLAGQCPDVDFYLEASNLAEWLEMPVHRKEACSKRRIGRWMRKAQADAEALKAAPTPVPARGVVVNGTWHPPAAFQRNPGPPPDEAVPLTGPLERIGEAELRAVRDANQHLTLAQKAARLTNGVHK